MMDAEEWIDDTPWWEYWRKSWQPTKWLGCSIELCLWFWALGIKTHYDQGQVGFGVYLGPVELSLWIGK